MRLSGHEARKLQEIQQRLMAEDPDLASLLSRGLDQDEPDSPAPFSARQAPHGPPATVAGTTKAMAIALAFLAFLVFAANLLSSDPPVEERKEQQRPSPQCHTGTMRDPACGEFRRYAPGS